MKKKVKLPERAANSFILSRCNTCPIKDKCQYFKDKFEKYSNQALNQTLEYFKIPKDKADEIIANMDAVKQSGFKIRFHNNRKELLEKDETECIVEKEIIEKTYNDLDEIYDLGRNKHLKHFAQQIIMLELYSFRLAVNHKHYGIMRDVIKNVKTGEKKLMLTPGIHYSIDITEKIANLLEKMNKIAFGEKLTVENVNVVKFDDIVKTIDVSEDEEELKYIE